MDGHFDTHKGGVGCQYFISNIPYCCLKLMEASALVWLASSNKDGRHNAMRTCVHNNILLSWTVTGALHWCSLAFRSSDGSASEPRGIKLTDCHSFF